MNMNDLKHNRSYGRRLFAMIAVISMMIVGTVALKPQVKADGNLPPMTLAVAALNGTQTVLNESDIGSLPSYRAYGGFVKSNGALGNLGNYTGVPLTMFLNMMGENGNGYSINVIAVDGYSKTLNYEALNGTGLLTYDNVTGAPVQHNQTLTPMLAYYYNDANLTSGGPLRLAIVGPEGLLTQSSLWVSNIVRLEVHPNLQPMNLTVVALNGTQTTINETDISSLPALRAVGGYRNQLGSVKGLGNYTGPTLNAFLSLVSGMTNDTILKVTAADNYTQMLTYDMVNGAFQTYDPTTGNPVPHYQSLTPILAYNLNDANVSSSDGPLKLAIIGPEGLATASSYWVKKIIKLEIRYPEDIAVSQAVPSKTVIGQGYPCNVTATAANQGGYDETFNVTAYANNTPIGTQKITLPPGNTTSLTLTWNTTGFAYGNYTLKISADVIAGETDILNNNCTCNTPVHVGVPGDVSSEVLGVYNGKTDMKDVAYLTLKFNTFPGKAGWDPNADVNGDGIVNMRDIVIAVLNFNKHE